MSSVIDLFKIFQHFPQDLRKTVHRFHVLSEKDAYCVTTDDRVFGFVGKHSRFSDLSEGKDFMAFTDLNDKQIDEFYGKNGYYFALSQNNQIYFWAIGTWAHLRGESSLWKFLRPRKIEYFDEKSIISLCSGNPCLALSSDGLIYVWKPEFTSDEKLEEEMSISSLGQSILSFNSIALNQFAVTERGQVYRYNWGHQFRWELFKDLSDDFTKLTEELGVDQKITEVVMSEKDKDMQYLCQTTDSLFLFTEKTKCFSKTDYKNLFEYYFATYQVTFKTVQIEHDEIFIKNPTSNVMLTKFTLTNDSFKPSKSSVNFDLSDDLPKSLKTDVKCFFKSNFNSNSFTFFVMKNDQVHVIGQHWKGKIGIGSQTVANDYTIVPELCRQNIQDFYETQNWMYARNGRNEIFRWGYDYKKQGDDKFIKPNKLFQFDTKLKIVDMSFCETHCLALTSEGELYRWDDNIQGQIGYKLECDQITDPVLIGPELGINTKIKFIRSLWRSSHVVDINGNALFWGVNDRGTIKAIAEPQYVKLSKVKKVQPHNSTCFILTESGDLFKYDLAKQAILKQIEQGLNIVDVMYGREEILFQTEDRVYEYLVSLTYGYERKSDIVKTTFLNFYDYSSHYDFTHKTIHISSEGSLVTKEVEVNPRYSDQTNEDFLIIQEKNVFEKKYENSFQYIREIGRGGFGCVVEVRDRINGEVFAIKRVGAESDLNKLFREIRIMSELKKDFVVQYFDSWIEGDVISRDVTKSLYIRMERCSQNLKAVLISMYYMLEECHKVFDFFISCELLRELTESVQYLHSLDIIHRDLKPENVLISDGSNGRFLKLCDFGLATIHANPTSLKIDHDRSQIRSSIHTTKIGTDAYMAPEVRVGNNYNLKSDIYSLALIATEIFRFEEFSLPELTRLNRINSSETRTDLEKYLLPYLGTDIELNFRKLLDLLSICLHSEDYHSRPDSNQIVEKINEFSLQKSFVLNEENISEFLTYIEMPGSEFMFKFFNCKLNFQNNQR